MKIHYLCKKLLNVLVRYKIIFTSILFYIVSVVWGYVHKELATGNNYTDTNETELNVYLSHIKRPTIVYWTESNSVGMQQVCNSKCDIHYGNVKLPNNTEGAYVFYGSGIDFSNLPLPRQPEKVIWALSHEESPRNVDELMHEKILNVFNFSSTFSRYSDVPFTLQHIRSLELVTSTQYFVETQRKNLLLNEISPILYLQSDCHTSTERDEYVIHLQELLNIDSYGACLHNKELPDEIMCSKEEYLNNFKDEKFLNFVARYKFVIAIENGVCEDYITEKLWRAIHVGVVPIYFGSPSIRDWLPNEKSALLLQDFPTPELLSQHIYELLNNDQLYETYLEHKTHKKISNQKLIDEIRRRPYQTDIEDRYNVFICFLCKQLQEKSKTVHIVTKSHYNCPKPISALTQQVQQRNGWVLSWTYIARHVVEALYNNITN